MKEIDFLPEWYKEGKRRRVHMRRQYVALTVVFLTMLTYNLTAEHRIARASARIAQLEHRRVDAEEVMREFNRISRVLGEHKAKADAIRQTDSRIDPAAVLAELSYIVTDRVILSRVEFISEPVAPVDRKKPAASGSAVRAAGKPSTAGTQVPLGDVRFRIVLAGVAAKSEDVGTLVGRLGESPYFKKVVPSFSRTAKINVPLNDRREPTVGQTGQAKETFQVSEFEITCYLANYEEVNG
ncbi:MAG: hypothetical protein JW993_04990 [Sedimentisphaerales bacterium]|nr:hypothetical protein [Sedimentisphaerales bacterium]